MADREIIGTNFKVSSMIMPPTPISPIRHSKRLVDSSQSDATESEKVTTYKSSSHNNDVYSNSDPEFSMTEMNYGRNVGSSDEELTMAQDEEYSEDKTSHHIIQNTNIVEGQSDEVTYNTNNEFSIQKRINEDALLADESHSASEQIFKPVDANQQHCQPEEQHCQHRLYNRITDCFDEEQKKAFKEEHVSEQCFRSQIIHNSDHIDVTDVNDYSDADSKFSASKIDNNRSIDLCDKDLEIAMQEKDYSEDKISDQIILYQEDVKDPRYKGENVATPLDSKEKANEKFSQTRNSEYSIKMEINGVLLAEESSFDHEQMIYHSTNAKTVSKDNFQYSLNDRIDNFSAKKRQKTFNQEYISETHHENTVIHNTEDLIDVEDNSTRDSIDIVDNSNNEGFADVDDHSDADDYLVIHDLVEADDHSNTDDLIDVDDHSRTEDSIDVDDHSTTEDSIDVDHSSTEDLIDVDDHSSTEDLINVDDHSSTEDSIHVDDHSSTEDSIDTDDYSNSSPEFLVAKVDDSRSRSTDLSDIEVEMATQDEGNSEEEKSKQNIKYENMSVKDSRNIEENVALSLNFKENTNNNVTPNESNENSIEMEINEDVLLVKESCFEPEQIVHPIDAKAQSEDLHIQYHLYDTINSLSHKKLQKALIKDNISGKHIDRVVITDNEDSVNMDEDETDLVIDIDSSHANEQWHEDEATEVDSCKLFFSENFSDETQNYSSERVSSKPRTASSNNRTAIQISSVSSSSENNTHTERDSECHLTDTGKCSDTSKFLSKDTSSVSEKTKNLRSRMAILFESNEKLRNKIKQSISNEGFRENKETESHVFENRKMGEKSKSLTSRMNFLFKTYEKIKKKIKLQSSTTEDFVVSSSMTSHKIEETASPIYESVEECNKNSSDNRCPPFIVHVKIANDQHKEKHIKNETRENTVSSGLPVNNFENVKDEFSHNVCLQIKDFLGDSMSSPEEHQRFLNKDKSSKLENEQEANFDGSEKNENVQLKREKSSQAVEKRTGLQKKNARVVTKVMQKESIRTMDATAQSCDSATKSKMEFKKEEENVSSGTEVFLDLFNINNQLSKTILLAMKNKYYAKGATMTEIVKYLKQKPSFKAGSKIIQDVKAFLRNALKGNILKARGRRYLLNEAYHCIKRQGYCKQIRKNIKAKRFIGETDKKRNKKRKPNISHEKVICLRSRNILRTK